MDVITVTGAEQRAHQLAARLRTAGWNVKVNAYDNPGTHPFIAGRKSAFVHATGREAAGHAKLLAGWQTITDPVGEEPSGTTEFTGAEFNIGDFRSDVASEAGMESWLALINAITIVTEA